MHCSLPLYLNQGTLRALNKQNVQKTILFSKTVCTFVCYVWCSSCENVSNPFLGNPVSRSYVGVMKPLGSNILQFSNFVFKAPAFIKKL